MVKKIDEKNCAITFDSDTYGWLKDMLEIKNTKCKFCGTEVTKKNVAGFLPKHRVFCNCITCLIDYAKESKQWKK